MKSFCKSTIVVFCVGGLVACTDPGQTTGIGAAAGGVVGAGLGAIVGSQVGSAGAGLVIGAASGAATGAVIGNSLESHEQAVRTQDEAIERQQQMIAANGRQIEALKTVRTDGSYGTSGRRGSYGGSYSGTSSTSRASAGGAAMGYSYPGSSMRLTQAERQRILRGEPLDSDSVRGSYRPPVIERAPAARIERAPERMESRAPVSIAKVAPVRMAPKPSLGSTKTSSIVERDLATEKVAPVEESVDTAAAKVGNAAALKESDIIVSEPFKSPDHEAIPQAPTDIDSAAEATEGLPEKSVGAVMPRAETESSEPSTAKVAKAQEPEVDMSDECKKASAEVEKASGSKDVADKLFHYRRALRLCPDEGRYHLGLGQVYHSLDRTSDAEFEFREALRLNPSLTEAREGLNNVR